MTIHMSADAAKHLRHVDSVIFDCDGVLIDVTESYDLAIKKTTSHILKKFANIADPISITPEIIDGFKATGGFNDEVDLAYACILSITAAKNLGRDQQDLVQKVIENSDHTGIVSVEQYLTDINADISNMKKQLQYPGRHGDNPLYVIFDELFYGPELFSKLFNKESEFSESGLIENDKVILSAELLSELKKKFDSNIAIVTGRGIASARHPLGDMLDEFNLQNSFFLEDEPRTLAKPNPESLIRAISGMHSDSCLYVGDSVEDLMMAKSATRAGKNTVFCGITGTSKNPLGKLEMFKSQDAQIIIDSIDLLPKVLNQV